MDKKYKPTVEDFLNDEEFMSFFKNKPDEYHLKDAIQRFSLKEQLVTREHWKSVLQTYLSVHLDHTDY